MIKRHIPAFISPQHFLIILGCTSAMLLIACSEQHKPVQNTEIRRTTSTSAEIQTPSNQNLDLAQHTFKVLRNNPEDYGQESYQIKTNEGNLSIYSLNLNHAQGKLLSSVKAGECLTLSSQSDNFIPVDGYISVMELGEIRIHPCK
ncbi:hypothetical protein B9T33_04745 [Acinetobacter sp. ANC 5054]|uniref:hypothetical protein n=1 Tax=Acinetobacter sp. ANC 5054 TaxID=1977877 RepID=UPI000B65AE92|nr:hypothetical protein [Acinetobacter sp. ANC 5054]OTG82763.1 hypothetical protein B9T33_04745 [Acinetobacter sp. ANC 5054]